MRIIAGTARGRTIEAPPGRDTRPTLDRVRENLFNMLQARIPDARVLDPFAGSGALSFEALSRGAALAVLGDRDRNALRAEQRNAEKLGFQERVRIYPGDWRRLLARLKAEGARFDLVFLDPPYAMQDLREITEDLRDLLEEEAWIVAEHAAKAEVLVAEAYEQINARSWGYCGVSFYALRREEIPDPSAEVSGQMMQPKGEETE